MLNMANIHPNITVLVVDTCCGLILGSVMERLGGYGNVINVYYGSNLPSLKVLSNFNFPSHYFEKLFHIPFDELPHLNSKPSPKYSRVRELLTEGVDSFLLVSKFEPKSIFFSLYQYLNLSKTFIVYSTFAQVFLLFFFIHFNQNFIFFLAFSRMLYSITKEWRSNWNGLE